MPLTSLFLPLFEAIAEIAPRSHWADERHEGRAAVSFTLPHSDVPRMDLDSLHRKLMYAGHTCISRTDELTPSILVLAPACSMSDAEGLAYFTAMIATGPTQ